MGKFSKLLRRYTFRLPKPLYSLFKMKASSKDQPLSVHLIGILWDSLTGEERERVKKMLPEEYDPGGWQWPELEPASYAQLHNNRQLILKTLDSWNLEWVPLQSLADVVDLTPRTVSKHVHALTEQEQVDIQYRGQGGALHVQLLEEQEEQEQ